MALALPISQQQQIHQIEQYDNALVKLQALTTKKFEYFSGEVVKEKAYSTKLNYLSVIASVVCGALSFITFKGSYKFLSIAFAVATVIPLISITKKVKTPEFEAACDKIEKATADVIVVLGQLTKAKKDALIEVIKEGDFKEVNSAREELIKHVTSYNDAEQQPDVYANNGNAKMYRTFAQAVTEFVKINVTQLPTQGEASAFFNTKMIKIHNLAQRFIYGHNLDPQANPDYVKLEVVQGKVVAHSYA